MRQKFKTPIEAPPGVGLADTHHHEGASATMDEAPFDLYDCQQEIRVVEQPSECEAPPTLDMRLPQFDGVEASRLSFLTNRQGDSLDFWPYDHMTGLPLSYAPRRDLPLPSSRQESPYVVADWEHLLPRAEVALAQNNPVLESYLGRAALVTARIQWVSYDEHHYKKNNIYRGPAHPHSIDSMTLFLLMSEAGYVPPEAVDLSGDTPRLVSLGKEDRDFLRESGQVRAACNGIVRAWLRRHIIEQNADNIIQDRWLEFLGTHDPSRKINLAHTLVAKLIEEVVEPIDDVYTEAHKDGLIPDHLPKHPREFLKAKLFRVATHGHVVCAMNERFGKEKRRLYPSLYSTDTRVA